MRPVLARVSLSHAWLRAAGGGSSPPVREAVIVRERHVVSARARDLAYAEGVDYPSKYGKSRDRARLPREPPDCCARRGRHWGPTTLGHVLPNLFIDCSLLILSFSIRSIATLDTHGQPAPGRRQNQKCFDQVT